MPRQHIGLAKVIFRIIDGVYIVHAPLTAIRPKAPGVGHNRYASQWAGHVITPL